MVVQLPVQLMVQLHPMHPVGYGPGYPVQHNYNRTQLPPSTEENISSLDTAVQHNFRRKLLVPSREENINSRGTAVQHNFRRTLLVPSSEENIGSRGTEIHTA